MRGVRGVTGWMLLARIGWMVVTVITVGLDLYAIPSLYRWTMTPCLEAVSGECRNGQITASGWAQLHALGLSSSTIATANVIESTAAMLVFVALAAVLFWRRPDDRMALLCAYMLVTFGGTAVSDALQTLPMSNFAWFLLATSLNVIGQITFVVFFFIFPSGRFMPRWTRWVALVWSLSWLAAFFPGVSQLDVLANVRAGPLFLPFPILLVFAQMYRYRWISDERQRQQTKWVVFGFALGLGIFAILLLLSNVISELKANVLGQLFAAFMFPVLLTVVPVAISIAILRSRLYDIDFIIRRTLIYGTLTVLVAGLYFIGVVGIQRLVNILTRQPERESPVIVVVTTLAIYVLIRPLRGRIQGAIDRRFYRHKYDATTTLSAFGETLRSEVELNALTDRLMNVVTETMQPAHISLWLWQRDSRQPEEPLPSGSSAHSAASAPSSASATNAGLSAG